MKLQKVPGSLRSEGKTLIAVDKPTRAQLKVRAGDMPVSKWLRGVAFGTIKADTSAVDEKTIRNSVAELSAPQPIVITGKDGKKYPATKPHTPKTIVTSSGKAEDKVFEAIE